MLVTLHACQSSSHVGAASAVQVLLTTVGTGEALAAVTGACDWHAC